MNIDLLNRLDGKLRNAPIEVRKRAQSVAEWLVEWIPNGYDAPVNAFICQDESVLIEWTSDRFRIGFGIEHDESEDGWYKVSLDNDHEYGELYTADYKELVKWALEHERR